MTLTHCLAYWLLQFCSNFQNWLKTVLPILGALNFHISVFSPSFLKNLFIFI